MLAACVVATITAYARKREWELGDLTVDVSYDNESTPRQVATTIHLPDGLTAEQIARLEKVAEACPVKRALEAGFSFAPAITTSPAGTGSPLGRLFPRRNTR